MTLAECKSFIGSAPNYTRSDGAIVPAFITAVSKRRGLVRVRWQGSLRGSLNFVAWHHKWVLPERLSVPTSWGKVAK